MNTSVETNVWGRILTSLKGRLTQQTLDTWFSPIQFESLDNSQHVIHLRAPNQVVKDWVISNYGKVLAESLNEQLLSGYSVGWVVGKAPDWVTEHVTLSSPATVTSTQVAPSSGDTVPAVTAPPVLPQSEPLLSSKYTYDSFVV